MTRVPAIHCSVVDGDIFSGDTRGLERTRAIIRQSNEPDYAQHIAQVPMAGLTRFGQLMNHLNITIDSVLIQIVSYLILSLPPPPHICPLQRWTTSTRSRAKVPL